MALRKILLILFLLILSNCGAAKSTLIPTLTDRPMPTNSSRWMIYEKALSKAILGSEGGLCEWQIYGMSNSKEEVYVWALCQFKGVDSRAGSVPAVIYLEDNGKIARVVLPWDGTLYAPDVRNMFPPEIAAKVLAHEFDSSSAKKNIDVRRHSSALPLIITSGTPLP